VTVSKASAGAGLVLGIVSSWQETADLQVRKEMTISNELLDSLLADYKKPEDLIGENGILKQLTKRLVEPALQVEMAHTWATANATA
jgi:hypothetical protein